MKKLVVLFSFFIVGFSYSQTTFTLNSNLCSGTTKTLTANTGTDIVLSYTWSSIPAIPIFSSSNSSTTPVNFPTTGTFTVLLNVTLASGSASYAVVVNVASTPIISLTQSNPTTCIASNYPKYSHPVFLSASGGSSTYTWNPPILDMFGAPIYSNSVYARPIVSTCYTISSIVGSCTGSSVSCVSVIPQYSFALSPANGTLCINDSLHLSVTSISTLAVLPIQNYIWYDPLPLSIANPYSASVTISPSITSTYTVEIFDAQACVSLPKLVNITVSACTGIHSNTLDFNISFYPNPFTNQLTINTKTNELKKLTIINPLGQQVYQAEFYQNNITLELPQLPSGAYIATLYLNTHFSFRTKLVKQ